VQKKTTLFSGLFCRITLFGTKLFNESVLIFHCGSETLMLTDCEVSSDSQSLGA